MRYKYPLVCITTLCFGLVHAQRADSIKVLKEVSVTGYRTVNGVGRFTEIKDGIIYAGKKNEIIVTDSLDANKAINNTRQILGRVPGLNIVETESSGFTANGIATRGLNANQSIEMNTRQNGYNISADVYGYNEAYYLPPMEAVNRIEFVRGASTLQFGTQFGGMVNYVIKETPADKDFEFVTSQTGGSYGLFNSFNAIGGNYKKLNYYGFIQYRNMDGYRANSRQWQLSGYGRILYTPTSKLKIGVEYTLLRNLVQMPGGLTDSMFAVNPKTSTRARNWLKSPWNIVASTIQYSVSPNTNISVKTNYLFSNRSLVWRNEDGGPEALDTIDAATLTYVPREVEKEDMHNITSEFRLTHQYHIVKNISSSLATGVRLSYAWFKRLGGGEGTTGTDYDLSITGNWEYAFDFSTTNIAPFAENVFHIGKHFSVTPGIRYEFITNTAKGYKMDGIYKMSTDQSKNRSLLLSGIGLEYKPGNQTSIYANISQAYRPIDYSQLQPFGVTSKIDANLKDQTGFNSDLGYRGFIKNYFNFDISLFLLQYNNRIGVVEVTDSVTGNTYSVRKNIANSIHQGIESYLEFNVLKFLRSNSKYGLSIFNSFAYTDAHYISGPYKGNRVEAAVKTINRTGVNFCSRNFSATVQANMTGDAFGDASNVVASSDPVAGYIPAYTVFDCSGTYKIQNFSIRFGLNNITNKMYFTRRTDEYPGPGIIPAIGRSFYIGFTAKF